jgi:Sulfotransferase family
MDHTTSPWLQSVKQGRHIFIYSVGGRSRSTFLQRIINSSKSVFVLGEHHYLIDNLCNSIWTMLLINKALGLEGAGIDLPSHAWMKHVKDSHTNFKLAIAENAHDKWYPNAMGEMTTSIELASLAVGELLHPFIEGYDRFGFKEIRLKSINTLKVLKWIFPNAVFLFVFRQPDDQWSSISRFSKSFEYSQSLTKFSEEYLYLASSYISFYEQNPEACIFAGEETLLSPDAIESLLRKLDIHTYERSLLKEKVGSSPVFKSRYPIVHFYRELRTHWRRQLAWQSFQKHGLFEIYEQLKRLDYSRTTAGVKE